MANENLSYSELKDWYTSFNNVISNYGGSISQATVPSSGAKAQSSDINNLLNKIAELAADSCLGTQSSLYDTDYSLVSSGDKIVRSSVTPVSNTATNIASIKCRNQISYSSGTNSSGTNSNGSQSNGTNSNGSYTNGLESYGANTNTRQSNGSNTNTWNCNGWGCSNNYQYNGSNSNGSYGNGTQSSGAKSNVNKTNGAIVDILNANTSF